MLYLDDDGTPRDVGARQRNADIARAYERIARLGARGFYRGPDRRGDRERRATPAGRRGRRPTSGARGCCASAT